MSDPDAEPFLSRKNIPLWICVFLASVVVVLAIWPH